MLDILMYSAPLLVPLLILVLGLLLLRKRQKTKARRLLAAENYTTGATTTSWEALHGPATLSDLPTPRNFQGPSKTDDSFVSTYIPKDASGQQDLPKGFKRPGEN